MMPGRATLDHDVQNLLRHAHTAGCVTQRYFTMFQIVCGNILLCCSAYGGLHLRVDLHSRFPRCTTTVVSQACFKPCTSKLQAESCRNRPFWHVLGIVKLPSYKVALQALISEQVYWQVHPRTIILRASGETTCTAAHCSGDICGRLRGESCVV